MSDSNPIDLSELQSLGFRPDWAESKKTPDAASSNSGSTGGGEVVWNFEQKRNGGGPRQDRGDRPGQRSGPGGPRRNDSGRGFENRRPSGPGGPGNDRRGPGPGGPRPERRDGPSGPPRPAGDRPRPPQGPGDNRGPRPERRDGPGSGPPRPGGDRGPRRDGGGTGGGGDRFQGGNRGPRREERFFEERPQLPEGWFIRLLPEPRAVEALSKQIKASGRAYSVFDVAKLFLGARDRYLLHFYYKPLAPAPREGPAGNDAPPPPTPRQEGPSELLQCTLDSSLWLTREEALRHIREGTLMNELYREETVDIDPPKGNFTAIAVCGFSGVLLGPPNHHSYPVAVARLHREKFANMSLDRYKARVHIEKDEETVKKWLDHQSKETQYVALKVPEGEEAPRFKSLAERDADFLKNHADEVLKSVREVTVSGNIPGRLLSPGLLSILRMELDRQNRFPMHLVQELCRELENHGLRFFKRDKKNTFVCRSRPQFIGNNVPLSDRVRSIIEMVRANPGIGYTKLVSTLAPAAPEPKVKSEPVAPPATEGEGGENAAAPVEQAAKEPAPHLTLSTDELAVMQDLKWLVQEGFITEFSNGELQILGRERPQDEGKEPREGKPAKGGGQPKGSKKVDPVSTDAGTESETTVAVSKPSPETETASSADAEVAEPSAEIAEAPEAAGEIDEAIIESPAVESESPAAVSQVAEESAAEAEETAKPVVVEGL